MSAEVCKRNNGMAAEVRNVLDQAQMLDDPMRKRLETLEGFLSSNQKRFAGRWDKYCKDLEIEMIDVRDVPAA